jgi:hypothetical protein
VMRRRFMSDLPGRLVVLFKHCRRPGAAILPGGG